MAAALESASQTASHGSLAGTKRDANTTPAPMSAIASTRPGVPMSSPNAERSTAERLVRRAGMAASHARKHPGEAPHALSTTTPPSTIAYPKKPPAAPSQAAGSADPGRAHPQTH